MGKKLLHVMTIGIIGMFCFVKAVHAASIPSSDMYLDSLAPSPFILGVMIVGGCIIVTLSYVSWKKYKGEKPGEKASRKNDKSVD